MNRENFKIPPTPKFHGRSTKSAASSKPSERQLSAGHSLSAPTELSSKDVSLFPKAAGCIVQYLLVTRDGHTVSLALPDGSGMVPWRAPLDAKLPLLVICLLDASSLGRPDVHFKVVRLYARMNDVELPPVVLSSAQFHAGELVRHPTPLILPEDASGQLVYWFEIETTTGELLWHSQWGANFCIPVVSDIRPIEVPQTT